MKFDFSGYATKNDLKCSDGRVIRKDAFKHNDGGRVPLVWQHMHNDPANVLGHAILENREDGVYAYGIFNDTEAGLNAKELVKHGDISSLSIFANNLSQKGNDVLHGNIREVSLVMAGANPGAFIDNLTFQHSDGSVETDDTEALIYTGENISLDDVVKHEEKGETVQEVFDTLNDKQKNVVYAMIAEALDAKAEEAEEAEEEKEDKKEEDVKHSDDGGEIMKHNVFETESKDGTKFTLTHDDLKAINDKAMKSGGSLKEELLAHAQTYGITDIDFLFPDAKTLTTTPEIISRKMEWVNVLLGGVRKSPFSRIKTIQADITADEARARGYVKGNLKKDEVIRLLKRVTFPTTIYKKQKLDRDDVVDIVDFDVISWIKAEMRVMLEEELARAILIGDGREIDSEDKINEENIRPVAFDNELYAHHVTLPTNVLGESIIEAMLRARPNYKGSGNPVLFITEDLLTDMLMLKDKLGRRLYPTEAELATTLRVSRIVPVEVMNEVPELLAIMMQPSDYVLGADKGGQLSMFDDFDLDYNQYKYLLETRASGALQRVKSALVFKRSGGTLVEPTAPTFVPETGVLTIPSVTGVSYFIDGATTAATAGAQTPVDGGEVVEVVAKPAEGYYFPHNFDADWEFLSELA